jgi:hypothetical protein
LSFSDSDLFPPIRITSINHFLCFSIQLLFPVFTWIMCLRNTSLLMGCRYLQGNFVFPKIFSLHLNGSIRNGELSTNNQDRKFCSHFTASSTLHSSQWRIVFGIWFWCISLLAINDQSIQIDNTLSLFSMAILLHLSSPFLNSARL